MFGFYGLLIIAALGSLILSPVFALIAARRTKRLERQLVRLDARLKALESGAPRSAPPAEEQPQTETSPEQSSVYESPTEMPREAELPSAAPVPETVQAPQEETPAETKSLEQIFASQWLVWLGGLTIALAGIFLVKYSVEHKLLSPAVRVTLGFLLGAALVAGGEWLRQRPLQRAIASVQPDYVPPALTGAGVLICFGSVYASYALFGLLAPIIVFVLLALIALAAMALSLLQGPLIAALGILGAFAVPLLVSTGSSSAWGLFSYLLFVAASAFAVVRYKDWWWLAWATSIGAALWNSLWILIMWRDGDLVPVSLHVLGMFGLAFAVRYEKLAAPGESLKRVFGLSELSASERYVVGAAAFLAGLTFAIVRMEGYGDGSLAVLAIVVVLLTVIAMQRARHEILVVLAAALPLLLLVVWHVPEIVTLPEHIVLGGRDLGALPAPIVPPEFAAFALLAGLTAIWFGPAGYVAVGRSQSGSFWAAVSVIPPLLALAIAYWRMGTIGVDLAWAAIAMGLASAATFVAGRLGRSPDASGMDAALGVYTLAVVAGISLAATMTLENAWLTVALALQLPAAAWVHNRFGIVALRYVSFVVAAIVGVRLLLAHQFPGIDWALPKDPLWILYGYGVPAAAFALAAHWFRKTADDRLVTTLESGAIAIAIATVSMEIRYFVGTWSSDFWRYTLLEQSLHSLSWLTSGYGLYRRNRAERRFASEWGAKILIGMACLQIVLLHLLVFNPIVTGEDIGDWLFVDVLALAYFLPALLALLIAWEARKQDHAKVMVGAGVGVGILIFSYITLEVRHFFHGAELHAGSIGNAEGYVYSVVWLLYAAALFAVGFVWQTATIRHAALGLTLFIVAKVFLWDMSGLTGLYRVASFLGLGLSLVAIGYFYQRFMFGERAAATEEET